MTEKNSLTIPFPNKINNEYSDYANLIDIYDTLKNIDHSKITLGLGNTTWISANLLAVIGAIVELGVDNNNEIFIDQSIQITDILKRNHFYEYFKDKNDWWRNLLAKMHSLKRDTIIPFCSFRSTEISNFIDYVDNLLLGKPGLENMDSSLRERFITSVADVFYNAQMHGQSEKIYICGQYFPNLKKLNFTILDFGTTIFTTVNNFTNKNYSSVEAIDWAIQFGNTTKPTWQGGLGLYELRDFVAKNEGRLQIISNNGYWEQNCERVSTNVFNKVFGGTIVSMEVNPFKGFPKMEDNDIL